MSIIFTVFCQFSLITFCQQNYMFSVTNPKQIRDNPVNDSTSKTHWSFSKAPRFKQPKPNAPDHGFQGISTLSSRKASIGYGKRTDYFDGNKDTISPDKYNSATCFSHKKSNGFPKGYNFGFNRDELNFANYLKFCQKTPAPKYDVDETKNKGRRYSLRPKTAYPNNYFLPNEVQQRSMQQTPGPGKYNTIECVGKKYMNSKIKNNNSFTFKGKQRFSKEKSTPGPADYQNQTLQPDGICLLSNMKSSGRRPFLMGRRELRLDGNKQTPGPGTYRKPSDFGHYEKSIRPKTARN